MTALMGACAATSFTIEPERAAEIDIARDSRLDVLRAAVGVADPLELERREVTEVLRELGIQDLAGPSLVAQFLLLRRSRFGGRYQPKTGKHPTHHAQQAT